MSDTKVGELILPGAKRDAIHIAVAPVKAAMSLPPGERIGFCVGSLEDVTIHSPEILGIVDPFLSHPVRKGDWFWMFLFPSTVTGMRHEWQHPAFDAGAVMRALAGAAAAEEWLRDFAEEIRVDYKELMTELDHEASGRGGSLTLDMNGSNHSCDKIEEMWKQYEIVRGVKVENHGADIFRCSC